MPVSGLGDQKAVSPILFWADLVADWRGIHGYDFEAKARITEERPILSLIAISTLLMLVRRWPSVPLFISPSVDDSGLYSFSQDISFEFGEDGEHS